MRRTVVFPDPRKPVMIVIGVGEEVVVMVAVAVVAEGGARVGKGGVGEGGIDSCRRCEGYKRRSRKQQREELEIFSRWRRVE